jgi:hypothetical protein
MVEVLKKYQQSFLFDWYYVTKKTNWPLYFVVGEVWRNFITPSWMCEIFNNALGNWNCSKKQNQGNRAKIQHLQETQGLGVKYNIPISLELNISQIERHHHSRRWRKV